MSGIDQFHQVHVTMWQMLSIRKFVLSWWLTFRKWGCQSQHQHSIIDVAKHTAEKLFVLPRGTSSCALTEPRVVEVSVCHTFNCTFPAEFVHSGDGFERQYAGRCPP